MNGCAAILCRACALTVLTAAFAGCEESVFPYNTARLYEVDPALISHREGASWRVPVEAPAFLAILPDGSFAVAGGRELAICGTNGSVRSRQSWQSSEPASALAAAPDGRIFVGAGNRIVACGARSSPDIWESLGENARIVGLAASSNRLWACDAGQRVVWRYDLEGRLLGQLPPKEAPRAQAFIVPSPAFPVVALPDGAFWVANPGCHELRHYDANGRLLAAWSRPGMLAPGFSGCCNPAYLAVLSSGDLVTSEKKICRVKIYARDGMFRSVVAPPAVLPGENGRPIAVDADDRILVLDGDRVRLFERVKP